MLLLWTVHRRRGSAGRGVHLPLLGPLVESDSMIAGCLRLYPLLHAPGAQHGDEQSAGDAGVALLWSISHLGWLRKLVGKDQPLIFRISFPTSKQKLTSRASFPFLSQSITGLFQDAGRCDMKRSNKP